eukprot:gb/GFBE01022906.1/.p1 GENE.gb/GFBE01022906.1/~~gb/GFBE01022906.1/.p1  ORF type:complete len:340 (+),score=68.72 gb/GFBE01022906.1/:1-1020(+)
MTEVNVSVKGLAGVVCEVSIRRDRSVEDLKRAIEESAGIPRKRQRLMQGSADLNDDFDLQWLLARRGCSSHAVLIGETSETSLDQTENHMDLTLIKRSEEQTQIIQTLSEFIPIQLEEIIEYLRTIDEHWLDDAEIMSRAARANPEVMEFASSRLRSDRRFLLNQVSFGWYWLQHAAEELMKDRDFILSAVKLNGYVLERCGRFCSDRDVVMAAIQNTGRALEYASEELRADVDVVQAALQSDGQALLHAADEFKSNKKFVLVAVKQDGRSLRFASEALRADREVVEAAIDNHSMAVKWVAQPLRSDEEILRLINVEQRRHERQLAAFKESFNEFYNPP